MKYSMIIGFLLLFGCSSDSANQNNVNINNQNGDTGGVSDLVEEDAGNNSVADSGDDIGGNEDSGPDFDPNAPFGGDRPATVFLPTDYDPNNSYPLVTLLHGYTATGPFQDTYFGISDQVDERQFIMILPDGLEDGFGNQYWNATPWCCGFNTERPDDIAYLTGLIDEAQARYSVDDKRIYFVGHSNGGFMSYTLACEIGDRVAGIASLAGSTFVDDAECADTGNVSILQIHGTLDATIAYNGSVNQYPGVADVMDRWVTRNNCDAASVNSPDLDLSTGLLGDDTTVERWMNCDDGADVSLWTINGGSHVPALNGDEFAPLVLDHLFARQKP